MKRFMQLALAVLATAALALGLRYLLKRRPDLLERGRAFFDKAKEEPGS